MAVEVEEAVVATVGVVEAMEVVTVGAVAAATAWVAGVAVASGPAVEGAAAVFTAVVVATAWVVAALTLAVGVASVGVTPVAVAHSEVDRVVVVSAREAGAEVSTSALHNNINSVPLDNPVSVNLIGPVAADARPMGSTVPR